MAAVKKPKEAGTQIVNNFKDVATALIKLHNLHEGIWRVAVRFGPIAGLNGSIDGRTMPAALVPITHVVLMRDTEVSDLAVDAAVVNPKSRIIQPGMHTAFA